MDDGNVRGKVLVVGDNDLAGLATVRSLGRAGLDVELVAFEQSPITRSSRYVRRVHEVGHPLKQTDLFVARLLRLIQNEHFDLVLPTSDKSLVPLMERRAEVERHARLAAPDRAAFEAAYSKERTLEIAEELGITVPRTWPLSDPADLALLPEPRQFPMVLKPICSVQTGAQRRNEVRIVRSEKELRTHLPEMLERCPVLVQEFCRGHGVGLAVLADRGELVAAFQHERVHEPPDGGASSYRKSVLLSPALLVAARRMFRQLGWTGPAMMEFKVDPATGSAALMEINGRLWGSVALAIHAGVDFPRLMYELFVHGQTTPTFDYRAPVFVRHTVRDAYWLRTNFANPAGLRDQLRKKPGEILGEIGNIVRLRERYDLESVTDPAPAIRAWLEFAGAGIGAVRRKLDRWRHKRAGQKLARQSREANSMLKNQLQTARSILFVCLGNINRSAVAEQALRRLLPPLPTLEIASAGFIQSAGRSTGSTSLEAARELGIDLTDHRSTPLSPALLKKYDLIFVMEAAQRDSIGRMDAQALAKTYPLGVLDEAGQSVDVDDPEGYDRQTFLETYRKIIRCVGNLFERLPQGVAEKAASLVESTPMTAT